MSTVEAVPEPQVRSTLRNLYVVRAVFSVVWLLLCIAASQGLTMADRPTVALAALLIVYPAWDFAATVFDIRVTHAAHAGLFQRINLAVSGLATVGMVIAVFGPIADGVRVFGTWAILAGLMTLIVAIRRFRAVGGQWPMLISGGLALVVGTMIIVNSSRTDTSPVVLANYVSGGAVWFLLAVITLSVKLRTTRAATVA